MSEKDKYEKATYPLNTTTEYYDDKYVSLGKFISKEHGFYDPRYGNSYNYIFVLGTIKSILNDDYTFYKLKQPQMGGKRKKTKGNKKKKRRCSNRR